MPEGEHAELVNTAVATDGRGFAAMLAGRSDEGRRRMAGACDSPTSCCAPAVVADFESRDAHLTGVPIADTAMLMEALAEPRGLAARPASQLVPGTA